MDLNIFRLLLKLSELIGDCLFFFIFISVGIILILNNLNKNY